MSQPVTKDDLKEALDELAMKLMRHTSDAKEELGRHLTVQDTHIDSLHGLVDTYAKDVEIYHQEMLIRDHQVERLEGWIKLIAQKTGVKLEY